ncbi:MAG: MATE family efflux transporter, partial [Lachnospiraceae bacterium]|nr:MATE family efflux transporter [Lachnospiraceae bacterium]
MAATDTKDMTTGNPVRLLLAFSMPLMLGNLFQQLYTFVDALIVGQCVSSNALAALGATEWLTFIMFGVIQGITQGCSVVIAGFFGEKQIDALKRAIYGGCLIAGAGAAGFTLAGQIAIVPGLRLLRTPPEVFDLTQTYLRILYAGVPITFLYNIAAAILRALGNSKKPLHAMIIASLGNIALDLLFVAGLDMGIAGAAYGTVLAQALAAAYCVIAIRKIEVCRIDRENRVPDRSILREQIRIGIPMGLQNIITAIGGLVVQATVNGFGILFLTGYAAANKVYVLLEIAATSYGHGILTYTAQNKGIGNDKRIRDGLFAALVIGIVTALMMSAVMVFAGQGILGLFIKETESGAGEMIRI